MADKKAFPIKDGDVVTFLAMQWIEEAWEFDFPSMLLEPVTNFYEDGRHCDGVIEDAVIDAYVNEELTDEGVPEWRGSLSYLKRVAKQVQSGKKFPKKDYKVRGEVHRFYQDENGELQSEVLSVLEWN